MAGIYHKWPIFATFGLGILLSTLSILFPESYSHPIIQGPEHFPPNSGHETFVDETGQQRCSREATDGNDNLSGNCLQARGGDDILTCTGNHCHAFGDDGNDKITGTPGRDWLHGNAGIDEVSAGDGDDVLFGDRMTGGPGADIFNCEENGVITDFNEMEDQIDQGNPATFPEHPPCVSVSSAGQTVPPTPQPPTAP